MSTQKKKKKTIEEGNEDHPFLGKSRGKETTENFFHAFPLLFILSIIRAILSKVGCARQSNGMLGGDIKTCLT